MSFPAYFPCRWIIMNTAVCRPTKPAIFSRGLLRFSLSFSISLFVGLHCWNLFLLACKSAHKLQLKTVRWSFSICFLPSLIRSPFRWHCSSRKSAFHCFISFPAFGFYCTVCYLHGSVFCVLHNTSFDKVPRKNQLTVTRWTLIENSDDAFLFAVGGMLIRLAFMQLLELSLNDSNWLVDFFRFKF